jgi:hypothetical protein
MRGEGSAAFTAVFGLGLALVACRDGGTAGRQVLGGVDLDGYCKSKGSTGTDVRPYEGKKTWCCVEPNGVCSTVSLGVVCSTQYRTTAHAEQEREGEPTSWICVAGPLHVEPSPGWNRANQ